MDVFSFLKVSNLLNLGLQASIWFTFDLYEPELQNYHPVIQSESNYSSFDYFLIVYSSHRCGYCRKLRLDFMDQNLPEHVKVIFIEHDTTADEILRVSNSYRNADVYIPKVDSFPEIDFYPTAFLIDLDKGKKKRFKGYRFKFWEKAFQAAR